MSSKKKSTGKTDPKPETKDSAKDSAKSKVDELAKLPGVKKAAELPYSVETAQAITGKKPAVGGPYEITAAQVLSPAGQPSMFVANLLYLMKRDKLTPATLAEKTKGAIPESVSQRWVRANAQQPAHENRFILAEVFKLDNPNAIVDVDLREEDRRKPDEGKLNPVAKQLLEDKPFLFDGLSDADKQKLLSVRGHGGALTEEGTLHFANILRTKAILDKVELLMKHNESRQAIETLINALWQAVNQPPNPSAGGESRTS